MATSPIYNWPEPDNTDLVKNGALAIRTLGDAIDTTMGTMVAKTIVDAKGDLIAGTAADTASRLAVGPDGSSIVADSSTSTGLRYQPTMAAGKNTVINGGMDIWQRGTSIAGTTTSFSADRWQSYRGVAGSTFSRQTGPDAIQYCVRVQRDSGNSSTSAIFLSQNFETVNSIPLAGKTVTLSFYARKGADYSRASSGLSVSLFTGTGTDQNGLTGAYTGSVTAISQTATLTTSWQRFTYSATLGSTATEINISYGFTPVGTAGAADYYEISGVQLEVGSVATEFTRTGGTIQGELAACQRYYFVKASGSGQSFGMAAYNSSSDLRGSFGVPVQMRTTPTMVSTTGTNYYKLVTGDFFNSLTLWQASAKEAAWYNVSEASGTTGLGGVVFTDNASASIALSAEL